MLLACSEGEEGILLVLDANDQTVLAKLLQQSRNLLDGLIARQSLCERRSLHRLTVLREYRENLALDSSLLCLLLGIALATSLTLVQQVQLVLESVQNPLVCLGCAGENQQSREQLPLRVLCICHC